MTLDAKGRRIIYCYIDTLSHYSAHRHLTIWFWGFVSGFLTRRGDIMRRGCYGQMRDSSHSSQGPDVNRHFSRSKSQEIRSHWVHLWCSPSAGCCQSAGRHYHGAVLCVFRESTPLVVSVWGKLWVEYLRLYTLFTPISDSHFTFGLWNQCSLFVYHFGRIW